jgi:hypothetical protein
MEIWQFESLVKMTSNRRDSMGTEGAFRVLVGGETTTAAAHYVGVAISTVSCSVIRIQDAQKNAEEYVARSAVEQQNAQQH